MHLSRRAFTGGAFGLAVGSQLDTRAFAQAPANLNAAVAAIRAHAEANVAFWNLPGLTLALTAPGGFAKLEIRNPKPASARRFLVSSFGFRVSLFSLLQGMLLPLQKSLNAHEMRP